VGSMMNFQLVLSIIPENVCLITKHFLIICTNFNILLLGLKYKHPVENRQMISAAQTKFVASSATLQIGVDETCSLPANWAVSYSRGFFACTVCGKVYRWYRNLQSHIRQECGKEPQFLCPYCPHRTKIKSNLKKHIKIKHPPTASEIVI
jgi:hypothetical protein